jgi:hypothetical protein
MHPCAHSWLDVESIAGSILAVPDRLIVFCPTHASLPPCSPPSKVRPREVGHCGVVCATADLDGVCARRRSKSARSGRRNGYRIEQRNRQECKHLSCQLFMVTIREGDSGRPSPSVLNNPASSPQLPCSGLGAHFAAAAAARTAPVGAGCSHSDTSLGADDLGARGGRLIPLGSRGGPTSRGFRGPHCSEF